MKVAGVVGVVVVLIVAGVLFFAFFWMTKPSPRPEFELAASFSCVDTNATFNVTIWNNGTVGGEASVKYMVWNGTGWGGGLVFVNVEKSYDVGAGAEFNATEAFHLGANPFGQQYCNQDIRWSAKLV